MKKGNIIFRIYGDSSWIGGIYYKKNIIYSVLQSKMICKKYNIILCITKENREIFKEFETKVIIKELPSNRLLYEAAIVMLMMNPRNKYLYCLNSANFDRFIYGKCIQWIPDFQYVYYPQYFRPEEIEHRNNNYGKIANKKGYLVLSSQTCKQDFVKQFPNYRTNIFVVPFVSYIETEVMSMNDTLEEQVLEKHNLIKNQYIYIPNQFWKHKNHIVVFEAIKLLVSRLKEEAFSCRFVFTGELRDYRNPEYIEKIKNLFMDPQIKDFVMNLGFLPRSEQLIIMKNAKLLIQPSLFEGWGTVLEDAKVLDKKVLLSDIPVHREQKNDNCVLFDPQDANALVEALLETIDHEYISDINRGICEMRKSAELYSKELERLFK